jgi:hypothetical protein
VLPLKNLWTVSNGIDKEVSPGLDRTPQVTRQPDETQGKTFSRLSFEESGGLWNHVGKTGGAERDKTFPAA